MKIKDIIIAVLAFWIFTLYKKHKNHTTTARGAEAQPSGGGGEAQKAAGVKTLIKQEPSPALQVYGSYSDANNTQRLTIDLPAEQALNYGIGQGVKILNSKMYPLYYKVKDIFPKDEKTACVVIDTLFVGAEVDIYLSKEEYKLSGFSTLTQKNKGSFL